MQRFVENHILEFKILWKSIHTVFELYQTCIECHTYLLRYKILVRY